MLAVYNNQQSYCQNKYDSTIRAIRSCILQRTCSVDREQLEHVMGRSEKKKPNRRPGLTKIREGR